MIQYYLYYEVIIKIQVNIFTMNSYEILFHVMRTFNIYSFSTFKCARQYSNYSHHAVHHIPRTYLFYKCKFLTFGPLPGKENKMIWKTEAI